MSKPKRSTQRNKADKLFSLKVRERGYCELAGVDTISCGGAHQCAHIIGRRFYSIRWDEDNSLCLCAGHHVYYTHNPEAWRAILDETWPGRYDRLLERSRTPWDKDYDTVLSALKA